MKKILLVDEGEMFRESAATILRMEEYSVLTCDNPADAEKTALKEDLDVILCDSRLGGIGAEELLKRMKKSSKTKNALFLLMTGYEERENVGKYLDLGADSFIAKPFENFELLAAISQAIRKKEEMQEKITKRITEVSNNLTFALPHEFRTPMNQIVFSAKYLKNHTDLLDSNDIKDLSDDIISSADRLMAIIENYVIYSDIISIAGNPKKIAEMQEAATVEPSELLFDSLRAAAKKYERESDLVLGESVAGTAIRISSEKYYIVIKELIDNAFKFSDKGYRVTAESKIEEGKFVFRVQNEGRGMTAEQISQVGAMVQFDRDKFEQQGIGLGLFIAKALIELHSGELILEGEINEGLTVTGKILLYE